MSDIYRYIQSDDYNRANIFEKLSDIAGELELEQEKPDEERNPDKEFKLVYKQFVEGLKLSTGSMI